MRIALGLSFLVSLAVAVSGHLHDRVTRKHLMRRSDTLLNRTTSLEKRFDNAKFSYYEAGLGACGIMNTASDFIVALNSAQFDSGNYCFQRITINMRGKSAQAQITDRCPGCPYGGLDFSQGLFEYFASTAEGIIFGNWEFGTGPPPAPPVAPAPAPTPTPTPTPTVAAPSSTASSDGTSHGTSSSTSTAATTDSPSITTAVDSGHASPSGQVVPGMLEQMNLVVNTLGQLIVSSGEIGNS